MARPTGPAGWHEFKSLAWAGKILKANLQYCVRRKRLFFATNFTNSKNLWVTVGGDSLKDDQKFNFDGVEIYLHQSVFK